MTIMWKDEPNILVNSATRNYIDVTVFQSNQRNRFHATFVHVPVLYHDRLQLWQQMRALNDQEKLPWLCIGDFNEMLYHWEKVGKRPTEQ